MKEIKEKIDGLFSNGMKNSIGNPKEAYILSEEIFNQSNKINYEHGIAKSYLLKAYAGQFLGTYTEAYEFVHLALPFFVKYKDINK